MDGSVHENNSLEIQDASSWIELPISSLTFLLHTAAICYFIKDFIITNTTFHPFVVQAI